MLIESFNKELFEKELRFLGHGDPRSAVIWFIGIDEGYGFLEPNDLIDSKENFIIYKEGEIAKTHDTAIMSKIITGLKGLDWKVKWKNYRNKELFTTNSEAFLTYMFPIGKDTQDQWPDEYINIAGMSAPDYYSYVLSENGGRLEFLKKQISYFKPHLVIFFGKSEKTLRYWKSFLRAFNLENEIYIGLKENYRIYVNFRVIVTPQFSNRSMTNYHIDILLNIINKQKLNPFK